MDDALESRVSFAVLLTLPMSELEAFRQALEDAVSQVQGVKIVTSRLGPRGSIWLQVREAHD